MEKKSGFLVILITAAMLFLAQGCYWGHGYRDDRGRYYRGGHGDGGHHDRGGHDDWDRHDRGDHHDRD